MLTTADILLAVLYLLGHFELMLSATNRGLFRLPDQPIKPFLLVAHTVLWGALAVGTMQRIGVADLAESLVGGVNGPGGWLCLWQWLVCVVALYRLGSRVWWCSLQRPPREQLARRSRVLAIEGDAPPDLRARLAAGIGLDRLEVVEITVSAQGLPEGFDGLRIAHLADTHYQSGASAALLGAALDEVARAEADIIVHTGDFAGHVEDIEAAAEALGELQAPLGAYAVLGNHDFWTDAERQEAALDPAHLRVLRNQGVRLEREGETLWLAGADDRWSATRDLDAALAGRREEEFCILLAHNPDEFLPAARRGVNLQLSGHTHGGQVALPIVGPVIVPVQHGLRFVSGLQKVGGSLLYVSRGIGAGTPIRIGSMPELTFLTLTSGTEAAGD